MESRTLDMLKYFLITGIAVIWRSRGGTDRISGGMHRFCADILNRLGVAQGTDGQVAASRNL